VGGVKLGLTIRPAEYASEVYAFAEVFMYPLLRRAAQSVSSKLAPLTKSAPTRPSCPPAVLSSLIEFKFNAALNVSKSSSYTIQGLALTLVQVVFS